MNAPYAGLLNEACVGLGFCGSAVDGKPLHVSDFIPESGLVSADQYADWTLMAEGLDPDCEDQWRTVLKAAFVRHMGSDVVDAEALS